jgi:hypothetical protein
MAVKQWVDAGFSELALVQIGPTQAAFCDFYVRELGPALRALRPRGKDTPVVTDSAPRGCRLR